MSARFLQRMAADQQTFSLAKRAERQQFCSHDEQFGTPMQRANVDGALCSPSAEFQADGPQQGYAAERCGCGNCDISVGVAHVDITAVHHAPNHCAYDTEKQSHSHTYGSEQKRRKEHSRYRTHYKPEDAPVLTGSRRRNRHK
jgi:hypothetical protein